MSLTKEEKVLRQLAGKQQVEKKTPIATNMFLPNHSGIASHPEFKEALAGIDLSLYWKRDGSSSCSGHWNISPYNITTTGNITGGFCEITKSTYPVVRFTREANLSGLTYWGAELYAKDTGTSNDMQGIGFLFSVNDDAGNKTTAALFGGGLADVSNGAEAGYLRFAPAWLGADPAARTDMVLTATGAATSTLVFSGCTISGAIGNISQWTNNSGYYKNQTATYENLGTSLSRSTDAAVIDINFVAQTYSTSDFYYIVDLVTTAMDVIHSVTT